MPSFATDSPLDVKIKKGVISDTLALLNMSIKRRNRTKNQKKLEMQRRLYPGLSFQTANLAMKDKDTKRAESRDKKDTRLQAQQESSYSPIKLTDKKTTKEQYAINKDQMRK
jgi:hypothetical protein